VVVAADMAVVDMVAMAVVTVVVAVVMVVAIAEVNMVADTVMAVDMMDMVMAVAGKTQRLAYLQELQLPELPLQQKRQLMMPQKIMAKKTDLNKKIRVIL
jgi:hypothetical protein